MSRTVALLIHYDGTGFRGFQRQKDLKQPTIQGSLESALSSLHDAPVAIIAAGRTDAGVHARGQVISYIDTAQTRTLDEIVRGTNAFLPAAIAVRSACEVSSSFHARRSALSRSYRYSMFIDSVRDPLRERFALRIQKQLNVAAMRLCAQAFTGKHDFAVFGQSPTKRKGFPQPSTVRDLRLAEVRQVSDEVYCDFTANAFLTGMVRRMVGVLLLAGENKIEPDAAAAILAVRSPIHPGAAAAPQGLCLTHVEYDPGALQWPAQQQNGEYYGKDL